MPESTKHFDIGEARCRCGKCGGSAEIVPGLFPALERLRASLGGRPVTITSAYRCPQHELTIQRPGSQHAKGTAADIMVVGRTAAEVFAAAVSLGIFTGLGLYQVKGHVHVDLRSSDPAIWVERTSRVVVTRPWFK